MSPFEVQLRRDLRLGWAGRGDMAVMLGFFLIILTPVSYTHLRAHETP